MKEKEKQQEHQEHQENQKEQAEQNLSSRKLARILKKQQRKLNKKDKPKLTRTEKRILKEHNKVIYFYTVLPTSALSEFANNPPPLNDDGTYNLYQGSSGTAIDSQILTVTTTYEEALEYIRACLILSHYSHYKSWCEIHGHTRDTEELRADYILMTLDMSDPANQFSIIKVAYTHADIGILLRSALHCIPIGCSYDDPIERRSFLQQNRDLFKQKRKTKENENENENENDEENEEEYKEQEEATQESAPKKGKKKKEQDSTKDPKKRNCKA